MSTSIFINNSLKSYLFKYDYLRLSRCMKTIAVKKPTKEAPKKRRKPSKEIINYMSSSDHLLKIKNEIPERFFKKNRKTPDDLYLVDNEVASKIAIAIKPYILEENKTIVETNPGFGFITEKLLSYGLKNIQIYESTVWFRNYILNLDQEYPGKLKLYNRDFFSIWNLSYQDRHDNGDRVKRMLSSIEVKEWSNVPAMTIIGTLSSSNFIRHLLLSLIFQFGVMTYGRCELFLTLPPPLYTQLTCSSEDGYLLYRSSSVLFQMFCEHELLLKLPRKAFLPWDNSVTIKNKKKLKRLYNEDPEHMYLTRIVFKKELPVPLNQLQHLWYFVQHIMLSRKCKIIPALEKWIPGCGIRLILSKNLFPDLNIFTESGQLTPSQILDLFKQFSSWPEYSESPFLDSMETSLLKMESVQSNEDPIQITEEPEESNEAVASENKES